MIGTKLSRLLRGRVARLCSTNNHMETKKIVASVLGVIALGVAGWLVYGGFSGSQVTKAPLAINEVPLANTPVTETPSTPSALASSMCGFVYPKHDGWSVEDNKGGGVDIVKGSKEVMILCADEIPGIPLPENKIESVIVDGVVGKLYHDASAMDGSPKDDIRVRTPANDADVSIRGTPGFVSEVAAGLVWAK